MSAAPTLDMKRFVLTLGLALAAVSFACASAAPNEESSDSDLSTSLSVARACSVRDTYLELPLSAFTPLSFDSLPVGVRNTLRATDAGPQLFAEFLATGVGSVYVAEDTSGASFYAENGALLVQATGSTSLYWTMNRDPLQCATDMPAGRDAGLFEAGPGLGDAGASGFRDADSVPVPSCDGGCSPIADASRD